MNVYFKLYDTTGVNLIYTFPVVFSANYPHSEKRLMEHTTPRAKGSIVVDGGEASWDLVLQGVLSAANYQALVVLIDSMESSVVLNTPYVLKINKTVATYYTYNVKRISPIEYQDNLKTDFCEYKITLRTNSW